MRLQDRVVIVTGGGSGIGQAIAELFAQAGAKVVVADRDMGRAQETVRRIVAAGAPTEQPALAVTVDVARRATVESMAAQTIETYGRVDILVNNAAIAEGDDILTYGEETWDRNLDIVLKSVFLCSKTVLPSMI